VTALPPRGWLALAAISLGVALWFSDGTLNWTAVISPVLNWIAVSFLVLTWTAMIAAFSARTPDDERQVERVLEVGVVLQFVLLFAKPPGRHLLPDLWEHFFIGPVFSMGCILMAMLAVTFVVGRPLLGRATFPAIVGIFGVISAWMLWASPDPPIDVMHFHREAALALGQGRTPYDLHFENLYGHTRFYGTGFATSRSIDVGSPYPPLSVLLTSLAIVLAGDPRAALVAGFVCSAVLIDRLGGRAARLASLLYISSPRRYLVLELGWTEPLMVAFLAAAMVLAQRRSRWLPVGLAGLLGIKQFAVLLLPFTPFLVGEVLPRRSIRLLAGALLLVAVTALPFVLWDAQAFFRSTVWFQLAQPFRPESLNFAALWAWAHPGAVPSTTVPTLGALALATLVALLRCRPTAAGFAAAGALVLLAVLAWSKQAHCNYYDLVLGLLACAVAPAASTPAPDARGRQVG
jgi:hypothetical protein